MCLFSQRSLLSSGSFSLSTVNVVEFIQHTCAYTNTGAAHSHMYMAHILNTYARTHAHAHTEKHVHPKAALLPPDLSQLEDVQHGLKDPHADGAAPPRLADPPCRVSRDSGRVNRRNVAVVLAALVAVLGA